MRGRGAFRAKMWYLSCWSFGFPVERWLVYAQARGLG